MKIFSTVALTAVIFSGAFADYAPDLREGLHCNKEKTICFSQLILENEFKRCESKWSSEGDFLSENCLTDTITDSSNKTCNSIITVGGKKIFEECLSEEIKEDRLITCHSKSIGVKKIETCTSLTRVDSEGKGIWVHLKAN